MPEELNPFQLVFSGLWELAEASVPLAAIIKEPNWIKFDSDTNRNPLKENVQVADLPELVLISQGIQSANLHRTSCSTEIIRSYAWMISTGDYRINQFLNKVEWDVFCAMAGYQTALMSLLWRDTQFVRDTNIISAVEGVSDVKANRGIVGWSTVWRCLVRLELPTAELILFNDGE